MLLLDWRAQLLTFIRTVQDLLGNSDVGTTMIYTHILKIGRWRGHFMSPQWTGYRAPTAVPPQKKEGGCPNAFDQVSLPLSVCR